MAIVLAVAFLLSGVAELAAIPARRQAAAHLGMTTAHYRLLGGLEAAAAVGLPAGLRLPRLGATASAGLVPPVAGAVIVHLHHGNPATRCAPAADMGAMAAIRLLLVVAQRPDPPVARRSLTRALVSRPLPPVPAVSRPTGADGPTAAPCPGRHAIAGTPLLAVFLHLSRVEPASLLSRTRSPAPEAARHRTEPAQ